MSRSLREKMRKTFSVFFTFLLLFQYLSPVFIALPQLRAQEVAQATASLQEVYDPSEEVVEEGTNETKAPEPSEQPEATTAAQTTESDEVAAEETFEAESEDESTASEADFYVETVELNHTYAFIDSQNQLLEITFTRITTAGSLSISEVTLSEEQLVALGSSVGYEITSSMENGSFTYDLKLPVEESVGDEDVVVKYAESEADVEQGTELAVSEQQADFVMLRGLDHFTVFVVTNLEAVYDGAVTNRTDGYCPAGSDWIQVDPGYFGQATSMHYACPTAVGGDTATWEIGSDGDFVAGNYFVFVSWTTHANRDDAAEYSLNHSAGSFAFTANQQLAADGSALADNEWSGWKLVDSNTFNLDSSSNLVLTDSNTPGVHVIASDVLLVGTDEVWVDDDWVSSSVGDEVAADRFYGYNAFSTIQDALQVVSANGKVWVQAGTYVGKVDVQKAVVIEALNDPSSVDAAHLVGKFHVQRDGVTISKMLITEGSGSGEFEGVFVGNSSGFSDEVDTQIIIEKNIIRDISHSGTTEGIHVKSYDPTGIVDGVIIRNNLIENITSTGKGGNAIKLQANLSNILVENNEFKNITGVWVYGLVSTLQAAR